MSSLAHFSFHHGCSFVCCWLTRGSPRLAKKLTKATRRSAATHRRVKPAPKSVQKLHPITARASNGAVRLPRLKWAAARHRTLGAVVPGRESKRHARMPPPESRYGDPRGDVAYIVRVRSSPFTSTCPPRFMHYTAARFGPICVWTLSNTTHNNTIFTLRPPPPCFLI